MLSGTGLQVWETFTFAMMDTKVADAVVRDFPFEGTPMVGPSIWRMKVEIHHNRAVLSIRITYQGTTSPLSDEAQAAAKEDAEDVILAPLAEILAANECPDNAQPSTSSGSKPDGDKKSGNSDRSDQGGKGQGGQDQGRPPRRDLGPRNTGKGGGNRT